MGAASLKWRWIGVAFLLLIIFLQLPICRTPQAQACLSLTIFVSTLWATEAIPFFATAFAIPLLAVPLGVLGSIEGRNVTHEQAAKALLTSMFTGTQVLVLGGLVMGRALQNNMEHEISRFVLSSVRLRKSPNLFLLVFMFVAAFACAFLSNVAAPVLLLNVIQPTLWRMPRNANTGVGPQQAILLALAFACNFGGMLTPIASPQNAVAQQTISLRAIQGAPGQSSTADPEISFAAWIGGSLPVVVSGILLTWVTLVVMWSPFPPGSEIPSIDDGDNSVSGHDGDAKQHRSSAGNSNSLQDNDNDDEVEMTASPKVNDDDGTQVEPTTTAAAAGAASAEIEIPAGQPEDYAAKRGLILSTCCITIFLWVMPIEGIFGSKSVVALIPVVVFFGVGVLSKEDFNGLSWHLLFLLAGGNMLGVCAKDSGLLNDTIAGLKPFLTNNTQFAVVAVLILSVAVITTFVSHTVASLILMPVIVEIAGVNKDLPSAQALVFLTVIMCSGAMAFPISSFPNVNSLLAEDEHGKPYLDARNYIVPGSILSVLCVLELISFMLPLVNSLLPK